MNNSLLFQGTIISSKKVLQHWPTKTISNREFIWNVSTEIWVYRRPKKWWFTALDICHKKLLNILYNFKIWGKLIAVAMLGTWAGVVMWLDSCFEGCGFESQLRILDGHFFTLVCCKNSNVCWKKTENKRKRGGGWPSFVNNNKYLLWMLRFNALLSKALNLRVCIQAILSKIIGKQSNRAKDRWCSEKKTRNEFVLLVCPQFGYRTENHRIVALALAYYQPEDCNECNSNLV